MKENNNPLTKSGEFEFIKIPLCADHSKLKSKASVYILASISSWLGGTKKEYYFTNHQIQNFLKTKLNLDFSINTISSSIKELANNNFIFVKNPNSRMRIISVAPPSVDELAETWQQSKLNIEKNIAKQQFDLQAQTIQPTSTLGGQPTSTLGAKKEENKKDIIKKDTPLPPTKRGSVSEANDLLIFWQDNKQSKRPFLNKSKQIKALNDLLEIYDFQVIKGMIKILIVADANSFANGFKYCPRILNPIKLATSTYAERLDVFIRNQAEHQSELEKKIENAIL